MRLVQQNINEGCPIVSVIYTYPMIEICDNTDIYAKYMVTPLPICALLFA